MDLSDLLVSYKQVKAPSRPIPSIVTLDSSTYMEPTVQEESQPVKQSQLAEQPRTTSYSISLSSVRAPGFGRKWTSPYKDKNKWTKDLTAAYKRAGLGDNAIKNLVAKNALESGWGRSAQGDYNFGNITTGKSWKGRFVGGNDSNADGKPIKQKFRAYDSMDDYVKDEIQFLTKLYDFNQDDNFDSFINKLQGQNSGKRKYAEDRSYIDKVRSVYNSLKM